jgi:hypothetical protein
MSYEIGDKVRYHIEGHGCSPAEAWVIGVPSFSDGKHVTLATEQTHGMPINICWCSKIDGADADGAQRWRERYLSMYPGVLKP